jgi:hypothetical protein
MFHSTGVPAPAIGLKLTDRDACRKLVCLLRGVDHLGEQEDGSRCIDRSGFGQDGWLQ